MLMSIVQLFKLYRLRPFASKIEIGHFSPQITLIEKIFNCFTEEPDFSSTGVVLAADAIGCVRFGPRRHFYVQDEFAPFRLFWHVSSKTD